ncbi:MAG: HEAT repeat domain-containing protein [Chloroflexi bacterium]|nr:HEAT repeat domain-containing protein [Chloroflexota bacterium]
MGFDVENFGLGLLTGWATAYGVYRARHRIRAAVRSVRGQVESAQSFATQSADNRYITDIVRLAESTHLAGRFANLSDILVEPRFLPPPPLAAPPSDDVVRSVFHVVPQVHDHPYLHAPYNLETLSIDDLSTGERALALLGRPGSGRTTALMAIALRSLGRLHFEQPIDKVQQRIDAEDAALTDKQRAVRVKERLTIEQRAKERLAEEQGATFETATDIPAGLSRFNRLMPVYVHLLDVDVKDPEYGKAVDPAEPLVRAVQRQVGRITASTIPRNLYERLGRGGVLLLVDGSDELPEAERGLKLGWLQALMDQYPQNFFIVTGPVVGYGPLLRLGLTPVFLRPWTDMDVTRAADQWAAAWPRLAGTRRQPAPDVDAAAVTRARTNSRALSPFELTLKIWGNYAGDAEAAGMEGWLRGLISRHLPADQPLESDLLPLAQTAALQLDESAITLAQMEALFAGRPAFHISEGEAEPDEIEPPAKKGSKQGQPDKKEDVSAASKFLTLLRRSRLVVRYVGGRYRFAHPLLAAYLASLMLKDQPELLAEKAMQPAWSQAIRYAALHTPVEAAVRARLGAPPDVLHNHVLEIANWLAYASGDVPWRNLYLKALGNLLIAPTQHPYLRERAAAALLTTRDRNAAVVFRQAIRSPQPRLKQIAALGLGAMGNPDAVTDIVPLLDDDDSETQLAAGLALGAIGTEEAIEALVGAFTEGSEQLRQAVAETFAAIPEEGYPILYDAIQDQDMLLRRAAVFGLRRVRAPWALTAIYRAFLEDSQWYVRSAAQMAFQELQYGGDRGVKGYPLPDALPWLAEWAAQRGENLPAGEGAMHMLMRALQEGEPETRQLAAAVIGQMGLASVGKTLYAALRDRQADIRDTAYRALAELQFQIGRPLPVA